MDYVIGKKKNHTEGKENHKEKQSGKRICTRMTDAKDSTYE